MVPTKPLQSGQFMAYDLPPSSGIRRMKVISRYIAWQTLRGIIVAFCIVTSIIMLVDFVEGTRNIGADDDLHAGQVFMLTALKTPQLIEQTIPFIVLFGVMGALFAMNRRSELIIMRASGLSAWRFLRPAIFVVLIIGVLWSLIFNPMATSAMRQYDNIKSSYSGGAQAGAGETIWLREGTEFEQTVIFAPYFSLVDRTLFDPEFTVFKADETGDLVFNSRLDAAEAKLLPGGFWQLTDVLESWPDGQQQVNKSMSFKTSITPQKFQESQSKRGLSPLWKLPAEIKALSQAGFSSTSLKIQYHKLLSLPLTLIAMAVIAAGVSMRLTREGGALGFMLKGAIIGFAVYFIENTIRAFGEAGSISASFAVWVIPIFVLACGLAYLSGLEDG
ncbi:MAG: LptF/LptG family permease [Hellea sp.]|nr:LptF/LptG family permease [Hellea sp.]